MNLFTTYLALVFRHVNFLGVFDLKFSFDMLTKNCTSHETSAIDASLHECVRVLACNEA